MIVLFFLPVKEQETLLLFSKITPTSAKLALWSLSLQLDENLYRQSIEFTTFVHLFSFDYCYEAKESMVPESQYRTAWF